MPAARRLLAKLEPLVTCPFCRHILHRPRTVPGCQHSVCRLCLDQILARRAAPQCPACQLAPPTAAPAPSDAERLVSCYHILRRASQREPASLQSRESGVSDATIDTVVDRRSSPELSQETPPGRAQMVYAGSGARQRASAIDAELRSGLVSDLVGDSSGSDTDLDLPNPASFLTPSQRQTTPPEEPADGAVSCVPETPPARAGAPAAPLVRTPGSPRGRATYSARGTPRGRRSLGSALAARARQPPPAQSPVSSGSNLTAVDAPAEGAPVESSPRARRPGAKRKLAASPPTPAKRRLAADASPPAPAAAAAAVAAAEQTAPALRLLCTGLSEAQMTRLQRAAAQAQERLGTAATVCRDASQLGTSEGAYTHLVAATTGRDRRAARTFKYMAGLAAGAWAVTAAWLLDSVKAGRLLPEADYAVAGDRAQPQFALAGPRRAGELLRGHAVLLWGDQAGWDAGAAHSCADLRALVAAVGATVVDELPPARDAEGGGLSSPDASQDRDRPSVTCTDKELAALPPKYRRLFELPVRDGDTIVLVSSCDLAGARSTVALGAIVAATGGAAPCRTKTWLFDCISANMVVK